MHELSIAHSLVEVAEHAARDAGATAVQTVYLRLGALSGVVKEALLFGFEVATEGTLLAGARLEIEEVPVTIFCEVCAREVMLLHPQRFRCPECGTPSGRIVHGRELELTSIEIRESDGTTTD